MLVVEGAQYSGSAITAKLAMDQGREVFAVPGNITSKLSWGPNLLIKQGAKIVQDWNDVVVELPAGRPAASRSRSGQGPGLKADDPRRATDLYLPWRPAGRDLPGSARAASRWTPPYIWTICLKDWRTAPRPR